MEMTHFRRKGNRARGSDVADRGERSVYRSAAESTELVICITAHVEDRMVDENAMGPKRPVHSWKRMLLMATVNPTFVAIQNPTVLACRLRGSQSAVLAFQQNWPRGTDARMGNQDVAETLSRLGRLEDGAGASFRDQSHDDPPLDQDRAAGPGLAGRSARRFAAPSGGSQVDIYKAIIDARLEEFPRLSARRLFDEVRAAGDPGRSYD